MQSGMSMAKRVKSKSGNRKADSSVKRPLLHTFCPFCTVPISVDSLSKHFKKVHPRTPHVLCSACGTYFHQDKYPQHVSSQHFNVLTFNEKMLMKLREDFKSRYYVSSTASKNLLCTKCQKNINPVNIMEHVLSQHLDSYIRANLLSVSHIFSKKAPVATKQPYFNRRKPASQTSSTSTAKCNDSIKENDSKSSQPKGSPTIASLSGENRIERAKNRLLVNGKVPLRICKVLIYSSAYWIQDKAKNKIVRAKGHYKNITFKKDGTAYIPFGKMDFLVGLAAQNLISFILDSIDSDGNLKINKDEFTYKARSIVSNSVETDGYRCQNYRIRSNGYMNFGNQAIHVPTFIMKITDVFELRIHIPY